MAQSPSTTVWLFAAGSFAIGLAAGAGAVVDTSAVRVLWVVGSVAMLVLAAVSVKTALVLSRAEKADADG